MQWRMAAKLSRRFDSSPSNSDSLSIDSIFCSQFEFKSTIDTVNNIINTHACMHTTPAIGVLSEILVMRAPHFALLLKNSSYQQRLSLCMLEPRASPERVTGIAHRLR